MDDPMHPDDFGAMLTTYRNLLTYRALTPANAAKMRQLALDMQASYRAWWLRAQVLQARNAGLEAAMLVGLRAWWDVYRYGPTQAELAALLDVHPNTIHRRLNRMAGEGLVVNTGGYRGWQVVEEEAA